MHYLVKLLAEEARARFAKEEECASFLRVRFPDLTSNPPVQAHVAWGTAWRLDIFQSFEALCENAGPVANVYAMPDDGDEAVVLGLGRARPFDFNLWMSKERAAEVAAMLLNVKAQSGDLPS